MFTIIAIECPYSGARKEVRIPLFGTMMIAPCPECNNLVVVFCGQALPLNCQRWDNGTNQESREYLLWVLTDFLRDQISRLPIGDISGEVIIFNDDGDSDKTILGREACSQDELENLSKEAYRDMLGQWGDNYPETIFDDGENYAPPFDFGPDCPGESFDGMHQNTKELRPITLGELNDFKKVALKLIDRSSYFHRHLG